MKYSSSDLRSRLVVTLFVCLGMLLGPLAASAASKQERVARKIAKALEAGEGGAAFEHFRGLPERVRTGNGNSAPLEALLKPTREYLEQEPYSQAVRILLCQIRSATGAPAAGPEEIPRPMLPGVEQGGVVKPTRLFDPQPAYTQKARKKFVQGVVISQLIIDSEGCVTSYSLLKGVHPDLDLATERVLRTWVFLPARFEDRSVPVFYNITTNFQLQ